MRRNTIFRIFIILILCLFLGTKLVYGVRTDFTASEGGLGILLERIEANTPETRENFNKDILTILKECYGYTSSATSVKSNMKLSTKIEIISSASFIGGIGSSLFGYRIRIGQPSENVSEHLRGYASGTILSGVSADDLKNKYGRPDNTSRSWDVILDANAQLITEGDKYTLNLYMSKLYSGSDVLRIDVTETARI